MAEIAANVHKMRWMADHLWWVCPICGRTDEANEQGEVVRSAIVKGQRRAAHIRDFSDVMRLPRRDPLAFGDRSQPPAPVVTTPPLLDASGIKPSPHSPQWWFDYFTSSRERREDMVVDVMFMTQKDEAWLESQQIGHGED